MKKTLAVINTVVIAATIAFNAIASTGGINGNTVGGISDKYDTLFTPAGYAFAIWGIIYLALIAFAIFQLRRAFSKEKESDFILQAGPWMTVANMANILWLYAWLNEYIGLSLVLDAYYPGLLVDPGDQAEYGTLGCAFPHHCFCVVADLYLQRLDCRGDHSKRILPAGQSGMAGAPQCRGLGHADDHCGCPAEPAHDPASQYAGVCRGGHMGAGCDLGAALGQHTHTSVDSAYRCDRAVPGHQRAWFPQPGYRSSYQVQGILQGIAPLCSL